MPAPVVSDATDNAARHRFELEVDGFIAASYYHLESNIITFTHTEVPEQIGGRGIASRLIKSELDQVRARGLKVVAQCPFVAAFIAKHPDYQDLLVAS